MVFHRVDKIKNATFVAAWRGFFFLTGTSLCFIPRRTASREHDTHLEPLPDHDPDAAMLTRQLCLQQMRYVSARRSAYAACTVTPSTLRRGFAATRCLPARSPASGTRTKIGTATVVNVDSVPTILHSSDTSEGLTQNTIKNLEREYRDFLQNPWKLSEAIKGRLAKDRYEEALVLVRRASKDGQCVVCWNLVIGYTFQKQRLHAGIKLFNEVRHSPSPASPQWPSAFASQSLTEHPLLR